MPVVKTHLHVACIDDLIAGGTGLARHFKLDSIAVRIHFFDDFLKKVRCQRAQFAIPTFASIRAQDTSASSGVVMKRRNCTALLIDSMNGTISSILPR